MKEFNYKDYLKYQILKNNESTGVDMLCDISETYELERPKVDKPHDKLLKIVLSDKNQVIRTY